MLTNGVRTNEVQRPCKSKLLTLQIITVAAAVFTTAAYAVAFVIRCVVAVTNVVVIADASKAGDAYNKNSNPRHYYYDLRENTKNKLKNDARNCCCNELISKQTNNFNANECVKKNNLENYKCVVNTNNENIIYSTKALTQNNENTDFKDTRFCEIIANNVNRMNMIFENSETCAVELPGSFTKMRKYVQSLTNYDDAAAAAAPQQQQQLSLPFQTFSWFSVCWFSTLLFNMQTFATKVRRSQDSLYRGDNVCSSERIPLLSSLLWSQLSSQKSWPQPASLPSSVASVNVKSTSQTISAMHSRCNAFTMSYVMYAAFILFLLPTVHSDNGDDFFLVNAFSISPETTTPEFDYASRGQKKFGDKCDNTLECGFPGSICDAKKKSCQCTEDLPVTNHFDKCGKEAAVNESCFFNEQCEVKHYQTECRDGRCTCRYEMQPFWGKDGTVECKGRGDKKPETYIDPAMIGVLVGMALMFVIICVVLRLFSQARWRENRTIFNTPNPRLMNVSLLRDSKLLHGQERRGSRMSVRAPSRQPSMASLRPHSPNPSLGSRSDSANASNASATSIRSTRSNSVAPGNIANTTTSQLERKDSQHHTQQQQHQINLQQHQQHQHPQTTNITANPAAESVAIEIIVPGK